MPDERRGKQASRVLDMNDATMRRPRRGARRVKEQRTECENGSLSGETNGLGLLVTKSIDRIRRQPPEPMRAVDHANRAVVDGTRIEVEANRQHVLEDRGRRLDVRHASLLGPWTVARGLDPALRGYGEVLVPNDLPVRVGSFVEEEDADREARVAEDCRGELPKRWADSYRSSVRR